MCKTHFTSVAFGLLANLIGATSMQDWLDFISVHAIIKADPKAYEYIK
jgi:hypothetical protein